jgi:hypothetical protein
MRLLSVKLSALLSVALLSACGAGGGSGQGAAFPVTGIAATGAPLVGALVQIYDGQGQPLLGTPALVGVDGKYAAEIPAGAQGPFVFEVNNGTEKFYSVMADKSSAQLNINQLSHLIAAKLSPTGNPYTLAEEIAAGTASVTTASTSAEVTRVMGALSPLATALGLGTINPLTVNFSANGTGFDRMLDSLDVKVEPKTAGSQIDLTLKQAVREDQELPVMSFAHGDAPAQLGAVQSTKLVDSGLTPKIQVLMKQLTDCYAIPLADRVGGSAERAADITSPACRDAFIGSNPVNYRSSGMDVAKSQHFSGIFTAPHTLAVKFPDPKFLYTIEANVPFGPRAGDTVFSFRTKDENGNFQIERNIGRIDTDGKFRLVGNQYKYDIGVSPYAQRRTFFGQAESTYLSVGYVFPVSCKQLYETPRVGNPQILKVKVVPPGSSDSDAIVLLPNQTAGKCNSSFFTLANGASLPDGMGDPSRPSTTGFLRLQSRYEVGQTTPDNHPAKFESILAFAMEDDGSDFTDSMIKSIPQFGTWKFLYYSFDNGNWQLEAEQFFKTTARSMTVDGFRKTVKLPEFVTSAFVGQTRCMPSRTTVCHVPPPSDGPFTLQWTKKVTGAAESPTHTARIFGRKNSAQLSGGGNAFDDFIRFGSTTKSINISCGQGDSSLRDYCNNDNIGQTAAFNPGTSIDAVDLVSRLADGSEASHILVMGKMR